MQFDQPQSFTCPYCGKLGLTENQLHEHVTGEHLSSSAEVVSLVNFCLYRVSAMSKKLEECWGNLFLITM